ncbi:MAG: cytochrome bc complex cytochrome b subunit [Candidatus Baltobacteraceae bacterium]
MTERVVGWLDDRFGGAAFVRHALRKAFPDHWSFLLGEINLYCFLVLIATGTFLAFFFDPAHAPTTYRGADKLLEGVTVSTAYASALHLSFDVNAGLLIRQVHHWAALVFIAAIFVHMARIFFTGAFRRPREINWMVGVILLGAALFEGFAGYSLPDDLLSGVGLRIADSVMLSVPLLGTWASFLLLGGAFPSANAGPRLFVTHVYIIPAILGSLIALHLAIIWRQKHTQFRGPGRTEQNVAGSPLVPNYAMRSFSLGAGVVALLTLLGAVVQINPIWVYGPYLPWQALAPAQPDWYMGWLEGALRIGPPWGLHIFGHLIPPPFWPAVLLPGVLFAILFFWPFIERFFTRDGTEHNLLDRPRDAALRTAIGCGLCSFAIVLTFAGSDDVQARYTYLSVFTLTTVYRILALTVPFVVTLIAYAIALNLRKREIEPAARVRIFRNAAGGYEEETIP